MIVDLWLGQTILFSYMVGGIHIWNIPNSQYMSPLMGMFLCIFWQLVQLGPDCDSLDDRTKSSNRLVLKNKDLRDFTKQNETNETK